MDRVDDLTKEQMITLLERIVTRCKYDPETGCVNWTGATINKYGRIRLNVGGIKRHLTVTRVILSANTGKKLKGYSANHTCDNPTCIKPSHVYRGTALDNGRDAAERNTACSGENHHASVLTEDDVRWIRNPKHHTLTTSEMARVLGKNRRTISDVLSGKSWGHI